jgi:hypothetical protein
MKCLSGDENVAEEITSETNTYYSSIKKNSKLEEFKDENIKVTPINFIEKFMDEEAELKIHTK